MTEYRCHVCGALLFRARATAGGLIQIVCQQRRCRRLQTFALPDAAHRERAEGVSEAQEQRKCA